MEDKATLIESLFKKTEEYVSTNIELFKLKSIDKSAELVSDLASKTILIIAGLITVMILNFGLAMYIGELVGKTYLGFLILGGAYAVITIMIYLFRNKLIKDPVNDALIIQMLKEKQYE